MILKKLKFCTWNIHGYKSRQIGNKLQHDDFLEIQKDVDFIGLTETHIYDEILDKLCIPGFRLIAYKNRNKNLKSNIASGGIAVFVREKLVKLFSPIKNDNKDIVWVKIKKEISGEKSDIFIGTCYFSPSRSKGTDCKIAKLMKDISLFQSKGHVLINGYLNAWTGNLNDTISPDKYDNELGITNHDSPPKRNSQHKLTNNRGEDLLDLCKSLELYIANGRKLGDPLGNYTSYQWNGNSVVDYLVTSNVIFEQVTLFNVGDFLPMMSDHCPLIFTLEIHDRPDDVAIKPKSKDKPKQFAWSRNETEKIFNALRSTENEEKLTAALNLDYTDPNNIVEHLTTLPTDVADKANIKKVPISNSTPRDPPRFDKQCSQLKKDIKLLGKTIKMDPDNPIHRTELTRLKRLLKGTIRNKKSTYKETILHKMNWGKKMSNEFWKLLDKLEHKQNDTIFMKGISGDRWRTYFKSVLHNPNIGNNSQLPLNTTEFGSLDFEITDEEIKLGAYILRQGKSPGMDCISNEMIICLLSIKANQKTF